MAKEKLTTQLAFLKMLEEPAVNKKLGVARSTVSNWKVYASDGTLTVDKMEEMLLKYGATVVQEKLWKLNT